MRLRNRVGVLAIVSTLAVATARAAQQNHLTIEIAGQTREYILVTPAAMPTGPRPLVLVLHGHLGTAANTLGAGMAPSPLSAWVAIADREKVWVAALQGLKGPDGHTGWRDCRSDDSGNPDSDDVGFAAGVVRTLLAQGRADPKRLYVMGMSNGAMMSYRLALEMSPAPVAIAAVSGLLALHSDCAAPSHPVSVLLVQGTADPLVPYAGGEVGFGHRKSSSVIGAEATRDFWLKADALSGASPLSYSFQHLGADDTRAIRISYGNDPGPQVELLTIEHGGHVEPSLKYHYGRLYSHIVGEQNRDLESAEEAWRFFAPKSAR